MIDKISALGIPVVAISLRKEVNDDKSTLNPTLQNEEQAYSKGLKEGILLIGDIVNKSENAQALAVGNPILHRYFWASFTIIALAPAFASSNACFIVSA